MSKIKVCAKHGELSEKDVKQGVYKGKKYRKCKYCELERSRKYHGKMYENEEWVKKKHATDKERWEKKKEEIKLKRQKPSALEKRRLTYAENPDKYRTKCNDKQKEYRETLHDHYVKKCIQNNDKELKFNKIPQSMINLKRSLMMLKKGIKSSQIKNMGDKVNED